MRRFDALVLDGYYRSALAATRALGRIGYHLAVDTPWPKSRFAATRTELPQVRQAPFAAYKGALVAWLQNNPTDVVLPSTDWAVDALDAVRASLPRGTSPAVADSDALAVATSKSRTAERAAAAAVALPRSVFVDNPNDVVAAVEEVGLPCVLKPDRSWRLREDRGERVGSILVRDESSAVVAARRLVAADCPALVQEFVPGRNETAILFRQNGELRAAFALLATRTWPPLGGNSVMRVSIAMPGDLRQAACAVAEAAAVDGCAEVEFRRSYHGALVLMEINPRLTQNLELALRCGIDFAAMQVDWARGRDVPRRMTYPSGVRLSWLGGEARLLVASMSSDGHASSSPAWRSLVRDFVPPPHFDGLALDDPLPSLGAIARGTFRHTARVTARRSRDARPRVA